MKSILPFLKELVDNNNRDWFNQHKKQYLTAKGEFDQFINALIERLQLIDKTVQGASAKNTVFRIYRDVRFSSDKSPYKTHFGAYIAGGGRKSVMPSYYIHIDPAQSFIGGGMYKPLPEHLKAIRKEIVDFEEDFLEILKEVKKNPGFTFYEKDKLKRPPQGFSADHPMIEYLKLKHFIVSYEFPEDWVTKNDLVDLICFQYEQILPLNNFLRRALNA